MKKITKSTLLSIAVIVGFISYCYADDPFDDCKHFVIPFSETINIDGNIDDWASIPEVFIDDEGDNYVPPGELGTDLKSFSMAIDRFSSMTGMASSNFKLTLLADVATLV